MKTKPSTTKNESLLQLLEQRTQKQYRTTKKREGRAGVIYTRVSSQEQAENNGSLEVQKKYCEEYAQRHNIQIKEYFGGRYESAKSDGRKEFQRMLAYVRKSKDVSSIIVMNYDRFSRSGSAASQLSEDLQAMGITVKSVTQDIDTTTASGRLQENFFHLLNNFDNRTKSDRTSINTREVMLKGYWPYTTPLGYKNLKEKHRACFHEYVITDEGQELKKAFHLKAEGKLTNKEIVQRLKAKGVRITETSFRWILSNPFYAGYVTGKLVDGKLIEGKHPALVDLKTFLKVNALLEGAVNVAIPKDHRKEEVPLKVFARDEESGESFTGYKTKGNWYYKTKKGKPAINVRADVLNGLFEERLKTFEY
ncbi:MAG: recombinase family protein, partial [Sphingobacteriales bacterium]